MPKLLWPILVFSLLLAIPSFVIPSFWRADADRLTHPPQQQTFSTPPYSLSITTDDGWQTPTAVATFYAAGNRRWQTTLPHEYGPRFTLVSATGHVLFVDEYINVASPHALTILSPQGEHTAQYSFDDIQQTLNLRTSDLTQQATSGWWVSNPPRIGDNENQVLIETGGTTLAVNLVTGAMTHH